MTLFCSDRVAQFENTLCHVARNGHDDIIGAAGVQVSCLRCRSNRSQQKLRGTAKLRGASTSAGGSGGSLLASTGGSILVAVLSKLAGLPSFSTTQHADSSSADSLAQNEVPQSGPVLSKLAKGRTTGCRIPPRRSRGRFAGLRAHSAAHLPRSYRRFGGAGWKTRKLIWTSLVPVTGQRNLTKALLRNNSAS